MASPPDFLKDTLAQGHGLEIIDPTDLVEGILPNFSFDFQLTAIRAILRDGRAARSRIQRNLADLTHKGEIQGGLDDRDIDYYGELFFESNYRDSADSLVLSALMSAFLETFFKLLFSELKIRFGHLLRTDDWKPKRHNRGHVAGTLKIAKTIGLDLPASFESLYSALGAYRNASMHNSLDWDSTELRTFAVAIESNRWKERWFGVTKTGNNPSKYALTDEFAEELMAAVGEVKGAVGRFIQTLIDQPASR